MVLLLLCTSAQSKEVVATVYNAVVEQCNSDPGHTASMFKLDLKNPYKHKVIAVSRDLRSTYPYGTKVLVTGTDYDGIYTVEDTMNKRYTNRIDILINIDMPIGKWHNVKITKVTEMAFKPQLLPNNKAGEAPDWEERLGDTKEWLVSTKYDGCRVEIFADGKVKGRSLKDIPSIYIQRMAEDFALQAQFDGVVEAEFFSPDMTFAEIMHFFRCADVTSDKEKRKYQKLWVKTGGNPELGWTFPGRTPEWLCTWHDSLQFYIFDHLAAEVDGRTKLERYSNMSSSSSLYGGIARACDNTLSSAIIIPQIEYDCIDAIYQAYDQAIIDGNEGLVLIHKESKYKFGRHTIKSKQAFKIKEDNLEFDGVILDVEESTVAREGSEKSINELGRSVTSKLQDDRVPSGMAKGFKVRMEDGNELTVSLKGYDHPARIELLDNASEYIGRWVRFTGMAPVKEGGCPRHAHFTKGNFRDDK